MNTSFDRRRFLKTVGLVGTAVCTGTFSRPLWAADVGPGAPHAAKLGWRLGCNAYSLKHLTFYETIDKVASLGLHDVVGFNWQKLSPQQADAQMCETMSPANRKETRQRLADAGVKLAACYCGRLDTAEVCRPLFEFAKEMGIETLDGEPPAGAFDMLERLCDEYQLNVAVHNHAKPSPYWNPDTLLALFKGRSKRIGACCDTGHWARSGLSAVETLAKLQGRVITFDLKDVNDQGICVPFGTGKGDVAGILKELHRQQFRGVLGIEYDQRPENIEADLVACVRYFDEIAKQLQPGTM